MTNQEIEANFTYHSPTNDMLPKFQQLREKAKELGLLINDLVPSGREQSLAQTKLQEVIMWANAGIAIPKEYNEHKINIKLPPMNEKTFLANPDNYLSKSISEDNNGKEN